jgi:hypothetical protein
MTADEVRAVQIEHRHKHHHKKHHKHHHDAEFVAKKADDGVEPKDPSKGDVPTQAPFAGTDKAAENKETEKGHGTTEQEKAETLKKTVAEVDKEDEKKEEAKEKREADIAANPNQGKVASDKAAENHDIEKAGAKAAEAAKDDAAKAEQKAKDAAPKFVKSEDMAGILSTCKGDQSEHHMTRAECWTANMPGEAISVAQKVKAAATKKKDDKKEEEPTKEEKKEEKVAKDDAKAKREDKEATDAVKDAGKKPGATEEKKEEKKEKSEEEEKKDAVKDNAKKVEKEEDSKEVKEEKREKEIKENPNDAKVAADKAS